jgi:hypothetical protein
MAKVQLRSSAKMLRRLAHLGDARSRYGLYAAFVARQVAAA